MDLPIPANDNQPLLSLDDAASELGICKRTIRRHIDSGELAYIVTGAGRERLQRKIHPADLQKFREARRRVECPSISRETNRRTTILTSKSAVIGFMAQRNARLSAKQNVSKR